MTEESFKKLASYTLELANKVKKLEKDNWETRRTLYELLTGQIRVVNRSKSAFEYLKK